MAIKNKFVVIHFLWCLSGGVRLHALEYSSQAGHLEFHGIVTGLSVLVSSKVSVSSRQLFSTLSPSYHLSLLDYLDIVSLSFTVTAKLSKN
jgi:hypothetical protein